MLTLASASIAVRIPAPIRNRLPEIPRSSEPVDIYWKQDDSPLSCRLAEMMEASPGLREPMYNPTPWARTSKANFMLATLRSRLGAVRRRLEPPLSGRMEQCEDPDVCVEWTKDPVAYNLGGDAPIVVFLHTITGSADQTRWLKKYGARPSVTHKRRTWRNFSRINVRLCFVPPDPLAFWFEQHRFGAGARAPSCAGATAAHSTHHPSTS